MKTDLKWFRNYSISVTHKNGIKERIHVKAYRIIFPELPDIEFFIYRKYGSTVWKVYDAKLGQYWAMGYIKDDRNTVIKQAHDKLIEFGVEKFKRLYNRRINWGVV